MTRLRTAVARSLLDGDMRTLHVRCGSDLKSPLQDGRLSRRFL